MSVYPWQQLQWSALKNNLEQDRMPHAILLKGPAGLGKFHFARHLAQFIFCTERAAAACGHCRSCCLWLSENHPDFYQVMPLEKSKSIRVDQIRDLSVRLNQTAQLNGYQVAIIHPAESMNRASSNALLKTLEEPPGRVVIVLVSHSWAGLPATVISRCQVLSFACVEAASASTWLAQRLQADHAQAELFLRLAANAPLRALEMAQNHYQTVRDQVFKVLWELLMHNVCPSQIATVLLKQDVILVLHIIFSCGLDIMRMQLNLLQAVENQDCVKKLALISQKIQLTHLTEWLPRLLHAKNRLQNAAGINQQLLLENILLEWRKLS